MTEKDRPGDLFQLVTPTHPSAIAVGPPPYDRVGEWFVF